MKKLILFFILLLCGSAFALDCQRSQGVDVGTACTIFVTVPSDTTSVDLNLLDVNGVFIAQDVSMSDSGNHYFTYAFTAHGIPTEYVFRVLANGTNANNGGGGFYSIDLNINERIKDVNGGVGDINGATAQEVWEYVDRSLTDYNQTTPYNQWEYFEDIAGFNQNDKTRFGDAPKPIPRFENEQVQESKEVTNENLLFWIIIILVAIAGVILLWWYDKKRKR